MHGVLLLPSLEKQRELIQEPIIFLHVLNIKNCCCIFVWTCFFSTSSYIFIILIITFVALLLITFTLHDHLLICCALNFYCLVSVLF